MKQKELEHQVIAQTKKKKINVKLLKSEGSIIRVKMNVAQNNELKSISYLEVSMLRNKSACQLFFK